MKQPDFCYLYLTCPNTVEAGAIVTSLLEKHLIVCAKQMPITSTYWWKNKIDQSSEVLLVMESRLDLFEAAEKEVRKLHSDETFVLEAVPIARVSADAAKWMKDNLANE